MAPDAPAKFKSEAAMCAAFADAVRAVGWRVFPEFHDFDLYCVLPSGDHVGIEAKLRANFKVLAQAASRPFDCGPDFAAVLVPDHTGEFVDVARAMSVSVLRPDGDHVPTSAWYARWPAFRPTLPEVEERRPGGEAGPVRLTEWKLAALELLAIMQHRGHVTSRDIRRLGMNPALWINPRTGWLTRGLTKGQFFLPADSPGRALARQHPDVFEAKLARAKGTPA